MWGWQSPGMTAVPAKEPTPEMEMPRAGIPLITEPALPVLKGKTIIQVQVLLDCLAGNFSPSWQRKSAGGDFTFLTVPVRIDYGLTKGTTVAVRIPYVNNWASNVDQPVQGQRNASFGGLGDTSLILKQLLLKETDYRPVVGAYFEVDFPTGHHRHLNPGRLNTDLLGNGTYEFTVGFDFYKEIKPFAFYANLWYSMQTTARRDIEGPAVQKLNFPDTVTLNLAAGYPLSEKVAFNLELYSQWDGGRLFGPKANISPKALMGILPEFAFTLGKQWTLAAGVSLDLFGKNIQIKYTPIVTVIYSY
jgi:hypothetical protein